MMHGVTAGKQFNGTFLFCETDVYCVKLLAAYWTGRVLVGVLSFGLTEVVNGGIKDPTHDAVRVYYKCSRCSHCFSRTYWLAGDEGKRARNGYFATRRNIVRFWDGSETYEHIEEVYRNMWETCSLIDRNCGHRTRDFYNAH